MMRRELMHNTPEQVSEYLSGALAIVAELEVTDDLRVAAFTKAVDLLAAKNITIEQASLGGTGVPNLAPALRSRGH